MERSGRLGGNSNKQHMVKNNYLPPTSSWISKRRRWRSSLLGCEWERAWTSKRVWGGCWRHPSASLWPWMTLPACQCRHSSGWVAAEESEVNQQANKQTNHQRPKVSPECFLRVLDLWRHFPRSCPPSALSESLCAPHKALWQWQCCDSCDSDSRCHTTA